MVFLPSIIIIVSPNNIIIVHFLIFEVPYNKHGQLVRCMNRPLIFGGFHLFYPC